MRSITITTVVLLGASFAMAGCQEKERSMKDVVSEVGRWSVPSDAESNYSHLNTRDARIMFVRDKFGEIAESAESDTELRQVAAAIYLNFSMLQGKAIPNYCGNMNVDLSEFQAAFEKVNRDEESGVAKILQEEGASIDELWSHFEGKYRTAAKYELMSTGSSYSACKTVADKPSELAKKVAFRPIYPKVAAKLREAAF